jgi:hypothetical protein
MDPDNNIEPVEVFCGNTWEAELVKSLLEDAGIEAYTWDENTGTLAPWYTAPGGAGSVRVVVASNDIVQALAVVEEFQKNNNKPDNE